MDSVKWGVGKKERFCSWIDFEIQYALGARGGLERQWREWLVQYRPSAKNILKSFPYEGAAGYSLPLTAGDVDPMYASLMQTIHASDDVWSVQSLNERWDDAAKPMQDFLTWLDKSILKMYRVNKRAILEMVKLGTAIYKTGWTYEKRPYRTYSPEGKWTQVNRLVSRPFVEHVSLPDFLMPPQATAIQPDDQGGASWCAERIRTDVQRLRSIANASAPEQYPMIAKDDLERVLAFEELTQTQHQAQILALDYVKKAAQPHQTFERDNAVGSSSPADGFGAHVREVELYEIHARFPTTGDSEDDIVVWYHRPTRTVLRAIGQPFHHGQRPYEAIQYFPSDGFYGIGMCEQDELFQTLTSELFNFTVDNVLLVNSRTYAASAGSGIAPGEPIFPGKIFITDGDPRQNLVDMKMSEVYPSLPNLIEFVENMRRLRNGVSDIQKGDIQSLPSRTPASSLQSLLAEGKRRPDLTVKDMRYNGLGIIGLRMIQLLQQYIGRPGTQSVGAEQYLQLAIEVLGQPAGALVAEKLRTPLEDAALGLGVSINAVSSSANKDMKQQQLQNLLALHATQIGPVVMQSVQTAMQAQGTPLADTALSVAQGLSNLYTKLLEYDDITHDPESIVPQVPPPGSLQAPPPQPGAGGNPAPPGQDPRLAALLGGGGGGMAAGNGNAPQGAPAR